MKKHLTTLFSFAATLFVALTLASCGEEVNIDGPGTKNGTTEFIFGADIDGTRTSMNANRYFYWEPGDKIWVKTGSSSYAMSTQSTITQSKQATARFIVEEDLSASKNYPVVYTGYTGEIGVDTASTVSNTVTIAATQTQSGWNKAEHLAVSGDCGTGTAIKQSNGQYKFTLFHQAHYLVLYPYLASRLTGNYTLQKVEIISDNMLAGTYDIDATTTLNALAVYPAMGTGSRTVTLNCNGGFLLSHDVPDPAATPITSNYLVAVIHPDVHSLAIKYTTVNSSNETFTFVQDIDASSYPCGSVTPLPFELNYALRDFGFRFRESSLTSPSNRYQWGATTPWAIGQSNNFDTGTSQVTTGFWANVPNRFAMSHYVNAGGYRDNAITWTYVRKNGTETTERGGAWLKRRNYISGFSTTTMAAHQSGYLISGRPDDSVIHQYFFLPAYSPDGNAAPNATMRYWSSSPYNASLAYYTEIQQLSMGCSNIYSKSQQFFSYPMNMDGSQWFQ